MTAKRKFWPVAPEPEFDMDAYWRHPSRWCATCGKEFSDVVALIHAKREGHDLAPVAGVQAA